MRFKRLDPRFLEIEDLPFVNTLRARPIPGTHFNVGTPFIILPRIRDSYLAQIKQFPSSAFLEKFSCIFDIKNLVPIFDSGHIIPISHGSYSFSNSRERGVLW